MKRKLTLAAVLAIVVLSCGKEAAPVVSIVPQIVSTEVVPGVEGVSLYASVSGPAHLTGCGFGIVRDGLIREYETSLDAASMSFSLETDGLSADSEYNFYAFIANGTSRIQTPQRPFRTLPTEPVGPEAPTLQFTETEAVPGTRSALLSASVSETEDVTEAGFALSADGTSYRMYPVALSGKGISLTLEELEPDTEYHFYAWAVQREVTVSSSPQSFRTQKEVHSASFTTLDATAEAFSVVLEASLSDATWVEACGFGLSMEGRRAVEYGASLKENGFTVQIDGLQPDTEYTWYAFFLIDGARTTSEFRHFRTPEDPTPAFYDLQASAGITDVTLSARVSHADKVLSCGFAIAEEDGTFRRETAAAGDDGHFTLTLDGLQSETTYRFYAWATTEDGEVLSETLSFTTRQAPSEEIQFERITVDAGTTSATLTAHLSRTGGIEDCGFGLSLDTHDFIEWAASLTADGFQVTVSGLSPGTTYYYYAFFTLDGKTWQSPLSSFQTEPSHE